MSEEVLEPVIEPVVPPVVPPVKKKYQIQPTDKEGRAIGAPHVYYYTDEADLNRQLSETVGNGTRKIREMALGNPVKITAPEGAELEEDDSEPIPEFKPRELTADEKFAIANKLRDPATMVEAYDELTLARTGAKPEDIAKLQHKMAKDAQKAKDDAAKVRARTEALTFQERHPEFVTNEANANAMMTYLTSRKMAVVLKNFEIAYKALTDDGLLILKEPEPEPEPVVVVPEPAPVPRTEEPAPATRTRGTADLPSTIKPTDSSASTSVRSSRPSAKAIALMSATEFQEALVKWPDLLKR
jgi:hypothetical protein